MAELDIEALRRAAEAPELAGPADHEAVADDLAAAFAADPVLDWIVRDDARRPEAQQIFFRFIVALYAGQNPRIYRPAGGGAAAIWTRSEDTGGGKPGLADEIRALGVFLRVCGFSRLSRMSQVRTAMDANHPSHRPHDYLSFLGVRPEAQGRGVGSRLLRAHTERLDAEGRAAYLETGNERTLSLYQSAGFAVTGRFLAGRGGPPMWSLWREPQG